MGTPVTLGLFTIHLFWPGPTLGRTQNDHRPAGSGFITIHPSLLLNGFNFGYHHIQRFCHLLVHQFRVRPFDKIGGITVTDEQLFQLIVTNACQHRWIGNFVTIEVQYRQHRAITHRVEELIRVPGGGQRPGLCLAITHHTGSDQVRVIERRAVSVGERIPQLTTFVNRARCLRCHMAGNAAGKRELFEQFSHPFSILTDVGVELAIGAFKIGVGHQAGAAVTRPGEIDHLQLITLDHPVQMHIDKIQTRCRSPMAQ